MELVRGQEDVDVRWNSDRFSYEEDGEEWKRCRR